jgi:AcrR family transcriptional regulator
MSNIRQFRTHISDSKRQTKSASIRHFWSVRRPVSKTAGSHTRPVLLLLQFLSPPSLDYLQLVQICAMCNLMIGIGADPLARQDSKKDEKAPTPQGRRARKKEEIRQRIANEAKRLFLERGFAATTVEDIAAAADISQRSFFDYFPVKEDVVLAWHDEFQSAFISNLLNRPASEAPIVAAREALIETVGKYGLDDVRNHAVLCKERAIKARDQLKYALLEGALADALSQRSKGKIDELRTRLVAMLVVGALRVTGEVDMARNETRRPVLRVRHITQILRSEIEKLGDAD